MLGIDFFDGTAAEAVAYISKHGGLVVAPAAPSFIALQDDPEYRHAIADADLAIADSGWAVLFWRLLRREKISRISGLALFKALLDTADERIPGNLFFILPSEKAKSKTVEFARASNHPITADDCYVAPRYQGSASGLSELEALRAGTPEGPTLRPVCPTGRKRPRREVSFQLVEPYSSERDQKSEIPHQRSVAKDNVGDRALLAILESRKPKHIIVGIGGGMQDKLGSYLKHQLNYRPAIYCIGAAPGFVTGDQVTIPMWADRFFVGWIFRIASQPRTYLARYWRARLVPFLISKYGKEMPPLLT